MNFLGIIPARYHSVRLEGKPLSDIAGKPMIQHVYERSQKTMKNVVVATDDLRIKKCVEHFGGRAIMTSKEHPNGTTRCLEAFELISKINNESYSHIINIQGDEPLLDPEQLKELMQCFDDDSTEIATLAQEVKDYEDLLNESECFLTIDALHNAMYFSRSVIPFVRNSKKEDWLGKHPFYKHIGLYAYTQESLREFCKMPPSSLEITESLEQNRWLQAGKKIRVAYTSHDSIPVDTPQDLEKVRKLMASQFK